MTYVNPEGASRYPVYLRVLRKLQAKHVKIVFSKELSELTQVASSTIRRDFYNLGCRGKKGHGYYVDQLIRELSQHLQADRQEPIILVGVGPLAKVYANYNTWKNVSGRIVCAFGEEIGKVRGFSVPVYQIEELAEKKPEGCRIAVLCTYKNTQEIVNRLVDNGITGIINYSDEPFKVNRRDVIVTNVDIASNIQNVIVQLNNKEQS